MDSARGDGRQAVGLAVGEPLGEVSPVGGLGVGVVEAEQVGVEDLLGLVVECRELREAVVSVLVDEFGVEDVRLRLDGQPGVGNACSVRFPRAFCCRMTMISRISA